MNRKQFTILLAVIAAAAVATVVMWPKKTNASWGNTLRGKDGSFVSFHVHGFSTGEPIAVVLICGGGGSSVIEWSSSSDPDGVHEFLVDGEIILNQSDLPIFFNATDGITSKTTISKSDARNLFWRESDPTRSELLTFWKEQIDPEFEMPENIQ